MKIKSCKRMFQDGIMYFFELRSFKVLTINIAAILFQNGEVSNFLKFKMLGNIAASFFQNGERNAMGLPTRRTP